MEKQQPSLLFKKDIQAVAHILQGYSYQQVKHIIKEVRKKLNILPEKPNRKLPELLTKDEVLLIFEKAQEKDPDHALMLKLLWYTGLRVSELINLKCKDLDWKSCKLFIENGKGNKDRIVLFPMAMQNEMRRCMFTNKLNLKQAQQYLFISRRGRLFRRESIFNFIKRYGVLAKIKKNIYPHLFRHQHLTLLTSAGLNEKQIMVQSGHSNRKTLDIYQHLAALDRDAYEKAILWEQK